MNNVHSLVAVVAVGGAKGFLAKSPYLGYS